MLSGASSVIGDLLSLVVDLESAESAATTSYMLVFLLYLLGTVLLLLGLVGLYSSQSEAAARGVRNFFSLGDRWLGFVRRSYAARSRLPEAGCCASHSRGCGLARPYTTLRRRPLRRGGMAGLDALHGKGYAERAPFTSELGAPSMLGRRILVYESR